jgi:hypothetical protein
MSFKLTRYASLVVCGLIGIFIFIFGISLVIYPWLTHLQEFIRLTIVGNKVMFSIIGFCLAVSGGAMTTYAFFQSRQRYVKIRTGDLAVLLDENVIRRYLESYWKQQFPLTTISYDVIIKKRALQIIADLPWLPESEQEALLEKVKNDFYNIFGHLLGYPYDVQFFAHFKKDVTPENS